MNKKLMIIGIDSLDPYILLKFSDYLPNFKKLINESPTFKMKSIFPPDTIPAWVTIYTGLNPAKHGIIHTFDLFESDWKGIVNLNVEAFKGKTFWDILSNSGKKICVLFPQCAFPPWKVNGIMVSRPLYPLEELENKGISIEKTVLSYPESISEKYQIYNFGSISGHHPGFKKLGLYAEKAKKKVIDQMNLGLKISKNCQWDLFFIYFSELDIIQHFFWRYYDKNDPTYPANNPYKNMIIEFYKLFDSVIAKFMDSDTDCIKIIISDHGHKMRPPKTVNINEYFRKKGYLKSNERLYHIEKFKNKILDFVHKRDLTYWLVKLGKMKIISGTSKKIYTSSSIIDMENSLAYLSYFTGAKSYSEGGIHINNIIKSNSSIEYEKLRDKLIEDLLKITDNDKNVFEWIKRREDLYDGNKIHLFPDIVFKLKDEYGVFWSLNTSIIGTSYEHNISSGGHKEDAVFLISNYNKELIKKEISLMDIMPTILELYGIDWEKYDIDGENIFQ